MEPKSVSRKLLTRLPVYLNYLKSLPEGDPNISATAMAKALGFGDVQVRKDLAKVSSTGRRKTGRNRRQLMEDIEDYLSMAEETCAVIVGAGKLGRALLDYTGFEESGFSLMAGFDQIASAEASEAGKPIYPMNQLEFFCKRYDVRIGIITVPAECAQSVCDTLISCGICAIWNFAPVHLQVPDHVIVHNENLAVSLTSLRVQMKNMDAPPAAMMNP